MLTSTARQTHNSPHHSFRKLSTRPSDSKSDARHQEAACSQKPLFGTRLFGEELFALQIPEASKAALKISPAVAKVSSMNRGVDWDEQMTDRGESVVVPTVLPAIVLHAMAQQSVVISPDQ